MTRALKAVVPAGVILLLGLLAWGLLHDAEPARIAPAVVAAAAAPAPASETPAPAVAPEVEPTRTEAAPKRATEPSLLGRLFGKGSKEPAPAAPSEPAKIGVDCVVIVTDADGVEHASEDGSVTPAFVEERADSDQLFSVLRQLADATEVTAGRFHVDVPADRKLGVQELVLAGRPAVVAADSFTVEAGTVVTIHARWVDGVKLRVVDVASRVDLDDVTIVQATDFLLDDCIHPGDAVAKDVVVRQGVSPLTLAPPSQDHHSSFHGKYWVGAAGHAWSRIEIDFERMTELLVELGPGATLIVSVAGELPVGAPAARSLGEMASTLFGGGSRRSQRDDDERQPKLRLRTPVERQDFDAMMEESLSHYDEAQPSDFPGGRKPSRDEFKQMIEELREVFEARSDTGELLAETKAKLGETRFDGLPPTELVVLVEIGKSYDAPLVAGQVAATLVAGETKHVVLTLAPRAPPPAPVPLAGTLFVPASWDAAGIRLEIEPTNLRGATSADEKRLRLSEMSPIAGRPRWFRWSAGPLQPARYRVGIDDAAYSRLVDLAAPGRSDVEIVLPDAARLVVHLVDDATGDPVVLAPNGWQVAWHPTWPDETPDLLFGDSIHFDTKEQSLTARVPVGPGELEVSDLEWLVVEMPPQEIHLGSQELTVRLRRATSITFSLACDGLPVRWPDSAADMHALEAVGHAGTVTMQSWSSDAMSMQVTEPGRYLFKLAPIQGYAPVDPLEIDLAAGQHVTHVVELQKR